MSKPESVTIDGEVYTRTVPTDPDKKIVVLQRGWVLVGDYSRDGDQCRLDNASVIRVWGTTKGLGEIALNGPTNATVLDACGTARFDAVTTIMVLDVAAGKW